MKVYYIWDTVNERVVTSISHRSGIYTKLVSVVFAYTNLPWSKRNSKQFIIKSAELLNQQEIETE